MSVTSGGSEAHLSVFSNQHSAPNLLSLLALFHHHSLFLHVSDWVTVCPQASAAASLVPALHTDCVYW